MSRSTLIDPNVLKTPGNLVVIDLRPRGDYEAGHAPGAVHLDIAGWTALALSPEAPAEEQALWSAEIGRLGIDGSRPVAVYDSGRITDAARAWFILQWAGVDAAVVDGGWPALRALPGFEAETTTQTPVPVRYQRPADHAPVVGLVDRHGLRAQLGGAVQVLDSRSKAEYTGEDLRSNARGGHIPGAHLLSHTALLDARGHLNAPDVLRRQFADAGLHAGQPIVTHCQGGGRAALAALAALHAGLQDVSVYYLSFGDWARDDSCPIVKP